MNNKYYVDKINLFSIYVLVFSLNIDEIEVLEKQRLSWIYRVILFFKGIKVSEANFIAGQLLTSDLECVYISARRLAGKLALDYSEKIILKYSYFNNLNSSYGRNTIKLYISKHLQLIVESWIVKAMVVRELNSENTGTLNLVISRPNIFDSEMLDKSFCDINFIFYTNAIANFFMNKKKLAILYLKELRMSMLFYITKGIYNFSPSNGPSILTNHEDDIRLSNDLRNQLFWFNDSPKLACTNVYILSFKEPSINSVNRSLEAKNIRFVNSMFVKFARSKYFYNESLIKLRNEIDLLSKYIMAAVNNEEKYYCILLRNFFVESLNISALAICLNSKVFIFKETHSIHSDAIQLVSKEIGLKTICLQYSNMGMISPLMLTTADEFFIFSEMYKSNFVYHNIGPERFVINGYLYNGVEKHLLTKASERKQVLSELGVDFIISYFDESVQNNKWGCVHVDHHINELHKILNYIIENSDVALLVKTQFLFNSPSKLYSKDPIISKALSTGRYIEVFEGDEWRNNVLPAEIGLISDMCISHKLGATAGLETALVGARTILLNSIKSNTSFDKIYNEANIVFSDMDDALSSITTLRKGNNENNNLGVWNNIIHKFDSNNDENSINRISERVFNSVT